MSIVNLLHSRSADSHGCSAEQHYRSKLRHSIRCTLQLQISHAHQNLYVGRSLDHTRYFLHRTS